MYRTLEEKFLADFEAMESENASLKARVAELEAKQAEPEEGYANRTLDAKCRALGRKTMFDKLFACDGSAEGRGYDEYARDALLLWRKKKLEELGVSGDAAIDYFVPELEAAYEEACDNDERGE